MIVRKFVVNLKLRSRRAILIGYLEQIKLYEVLDVDPKKEVFLVMKLTTNLRVVEPSGIQIYVLHNTEDDDNEAVINPNDDEPND